MKLYLAGIYTSNFNKQGQVYARLTEAEKQARDAIPYFLESYHYIYKQSMLDKIRDDGVQVFLDSGAFSAFTKGVKVDLPAYCQYIKENEDIIVKDDGAMCASVLDGIGDPLETWQNQRAMEQHGVVPLPCFHYGEDERYLEWYMANYEYITLGGMVPISTMQLYHWLDRIWEKYLTDGAGRPKIKVHGFGLTTVKLMERYPWYSVDSSTWVQHAATGQVTVPGLAGTVQISANSPSAKVEGRHLDTLPPLQRQALVDRIEAQGFDVERLRNEYVSRWAYNCWSFTKIGQDIDTETFKTEQLELF